MKILKRIGLLALVVLALAACALTPVTASAADTPKIRFAVVSTGSATYTNNSSGAAFTLGRIYVTGIQPNDATVTVSRVATVISPASTNIIAITNTIATIVCTSAAGVSTNVGRYAWYGDKFIATGVGTNAGYVAFEGTEGP